MSSQPKRDIARELFKSFKTQKELKTLILTMIMESKIDKVLYLF